MTYHESTLWVLDPATSTVVGVLCLEHKISCVATNGKFVYVLCDGVARPLARFTVHSSFLKSIQKVKAREESDAVSVSSVPGTGDESGQGMRCEAVAGNTAGEEEVEVEEERARERDVRNPTSEELDPTSSALERGEETDVGGNLVLSFSSAVVDTSMHDLAAHQPHSQASHQPRVHTATLNEFPEYTIKTSATTAYTTTYEISERDIGQRSQIPEEVKLSQADGESVSVGYQLEPAKPDEGVVSTSRDSLLDAIETAGTPLSTSDPEGHHSEDSARVKDVRSNTEPVSDVGSSTINTAPATSTSPSQSSVQAVPTPPPTVVDPPSVTGPLAMQDLAREVTGLLRPAFGKLSGLMRPQERRRDGPSASRADQHSGTATPQESPDGSVPEEEEEGDSRGEGTGTPVELSRGPTPKLMLKLSGMLKEKVSVHVVYM